MGTTTNYGLRYPELADPADIRQIKTLADDVDAALGKTGDAIGIRTYLTGFMDRPGGGLVALWALSESWGGATTDGTRLLAPVAGVYHVDVQLTVNRLDEVPGSWEMLQAGIYDTTGVQISRLQTPVPWLGWAQNVFTHAFSGTVTLAAGGHVSVGSLYNGRISAGTPQPLTTFSMHRVGTP